MKGPAWGAGSDGYSDPAAQYHPHASCIDSRRHKHSSSEMGGWKGVLTLVSKAVGGLVGGRVGCRDGARVGDWDGDTLGRCR